MALTLKLKAFGFCDSAESLNTELFMARCGVREKDYTVTSLGKGLYGIHFENEPQNYRQIVRQWGEILEEIAE
jgi:hypothetical protein